MTNPTKVIIYDSEGNVIVNDSVTSPFVGLQAGEVFWFGSGNSKSWGKILTITYGLDLQAKTFVVEMVIESSKENVTKNYQEEFDFINHGEIEMRSNAYSSTEWKSNDSRVKITLSAINSTSVANFVGIIASKNGPIIERKAVLIVGDSFSIKTPEGQLKFTLTYANAGYHYHIAKFNIVEQRIK